MRRLASGAASVLAAVALATGCGPGPSGPDPSTTSESLAPEHQFDPAATTITYAFTDSSVPPEYHRSFTLTVEGGVGTIVVDSYGDETARDEQEVSSAVVEDLVDAYNAGELAGVFGWEAADGGGCDGGRTFALALENDTEVAEASLLQCAGDNADLLQALTDAADPLLDAFDIESLTEGRYEP
ncbi:hypothetical protein [Pseudactinotalea sp.]|uniref:hypothetical protein n=1 Tax=Pseudactinotalea sp. TaxID=1926260 RepID=UPI003B3B6EB2